MRNDDAFMFALLGFAVLGMRRPDWDARVWTWPVPDLVLGGKRYPAVISSGFYEKRGDRLHAGVDILYQRRSLTELPQFRPPVDGSAGGWFFAPSSTPIVAASAGSIWSVKNTPRGWQVVLGHGAPFATFYTHMQSTL